MTMRTPWIAARKGHANVTQMHYARQGVITEEMIFVAKRENLPESLVLEEVAQDSAQQLINIAGLPTGNYFLHLHTASGKSVMQFHKSGR